ncbi:MAG: DUF2914 domain-containing protein [Gemmatimonadota bacterium]|nr:MAG: DUF2914 domain-containing protein [Gemmatimonadota bacterium]
MAVSLFALAAAGLAAPVAAQEAGVAVEAVIARDVVDREPVDAGTVFPADVGRLFCWMRVQGAEAGTVLEHVWKFAGYEWVVPLQIGGTHWRTFSNKVIVPEWKGEWTIEIRDATGTVLETLTFTVQ